MIGLGGRGQADSATRLERQTEMVAAWSRCLALQGRNQITGVIAQRGPAASRSVDNEILSSKQHKLTQSRVRLHHRRQIRTGFTFGRHRMGQIGPGLVDP